MARNKEATLALEQKLMHMKWLKIQNEYNMHNALKSIKYTQELDSVSDDDTYMKQKRIERAKEEEFNRPLLGRYEDLQEYVKTVQIDRTKEKKRKQERQKQMMQLQRLQEEQEKRTMVNNRYREKMSQIAQLKPPKIDIE